jgi:Flp pilus assembly protein TadG
MRDETGQDIVEYALILPFLLLLTFSVIEGGWLFFRYNTVANAAREGARAGIVPITATCDADCVEGKASAAALALTVGLVPQPTVLVSPQGPTAVSSVVTVTFDAPLISGPLIQALSGSTSLRLQAVSHMQKE